MSESTVYYTFSRLELIQFLPKQYSRVLEIGCAEGHFRENLKQDCEYWGLEMVPEVAEVASQRLDKVLIGSFEDVFNQLPDDYFDLVICNDVIEHMVDHVAFLQSIKKKLNKEAYITGSLPNVRYLENLYELLVKKDWEYKNSGILDRTHLRFFTEKSLKRTITENGYEIEDFKGINSQWLFGARFSKKGILKRLLFYPIMLVFGLDLKYMQFGMRIKYKKS